MANQDFPTEQLVELMLSDNVANRLLAEKLGRKHRGWGKDDWPMHFLPHFVVSVSVNNIPIIKLNIAGRVVRYALSCCHSKTKWVQIRQYIQDANNCLLPFTECGGYVRNIEKNTHIDAKSILDIIMADFRHVWKTYFNIRKCEFKT